MLPVNHVVIGAFEKEADYFQIILALDTIVLPNTGRRHYDINNYQYR